MSVFVKGRLMKWVNTRVFSKASSSENNILKMDRLDMNIVSVHLQRRSAEEAWGFTLRRKAGGKYIVHEVMNGSPASNKLYVGDILLEISDKEASSLSPEMVADIMNRRFYTLNLDLRRMMSRSGWCCCHAFTIYFCYFLCSPCCDRCRLWRCHML